MKFVPAGFVEVGLLEGGLERGPVSAERPSTESGARPAHQSATPGERLAEAARNVGQRVTEAVKEAVRPSGRPTGHAVRDVMTPNPLTLPISATLVDAARMMRDADVGPLVVLDGSLCGVVTDRDLVVRGLAAGFLPHSMLEDICSREAVAVGPDDDVALAVQLMREHAIRRLVVVEQERVIGIVSLGDVAIDRDPESVLAAISSAPPQR